MSRCGMFVSSSGPWFVFSDSVSPQSSNIGNGQHSRSEVRHNSFSLYIYLLVINSTLILLTLASLHMMVQQTQNLYDIRNLNEHFVCVVSSIKTQRQCAHSVCDNLNLHCQIFLSSSSSSRIFLGILGFGLSIMFCTTFCRVCSRFREEQINREALRRSEQETRPPPIYFIPFHGSMSRQDSEDQDRGPRISLELHTPPRYSNVVFCGPPPSYNEVTLGRDEPHALTSTSTCAQLDLNLAFLSVSFSWD